MSMHRMSAVILFLLSSTVFLSALEFPEYTPVGQELGDQDLLAAVDVSRPGLAAVGKERDQGDVPGARALLAKHFRERRTPILPPVTFPGGGTGNSMIVLQGSKAHQAEADEKWLNHIYTSRNNDKGTTETHQLSDPIDWYANPSECFTWMLYLNQLNIVSKLAGIWRDTGDDRYALEAGRLVQSWVDQCWRGYCYIRDGKMVNSGMEVRNRLCNCIAAYDVLRTCPSLTPEMHMAFWKLFVTHARELMDWSPGGTHKTPLVAYPGLIAVAVMFPEFAESAEWMAAGMRSLQDSIVDRVTPEGAWQTHSISYQSVPYAWSLRSLEILQANSGNRDTTAVAELIRTQITKMIELQFRIALPNGGQPNVGDTYGRGDWGCTIASVLNMYLWLCFDDSEQDRLNQIPDVYERMLAALASANGSGQRAPGDASIGLTGSGYYVMRSGWLGKHQRYFYYDLTPQAYGHVHYDAGHVEMYAYGKPLITDTGDYFLGWGSRTALHNTIEVDGLMQKWGADMAPCEWLTTPTLDFVDGMHFGYEDQGVRHRRKVIFVKGPEDGFRDYWILADLLTGEGEHTYEQFFHLAGPDAMTSPSMTLDPASLSVQTSHAETANVTIVPVGRKGLQGRFIEPIETDMDPKKKTERDAMLGWMVSTGTFQRIRSPALVYTRQGVAPQSYHTVCFPTPVGAHAEVNVTELPVMCNGTPVAPHEAVGLRCDVSMTRPAHDSKDIVADPGLNLALGCAVSATINQGSFGAGNLIRLTDGDRAPTTISGAVSSAPHQPGVQLEGEFVIDLGLEREVNRIVLYEGTWNGAKILYPATEIHLRQTTEDTWHGLDITHRSREQQNVLVMDFNALVTRRIAIHITRPSGGRIAAREIEVYRVPDPELERVAALRAETLTERWYDILLLSHASPNPMQYGDFSFDGQVALLRYDDGGRLERASLIRAGHLARGDNVLFETDQSRDCISVEWGDGQARVAGPSCRGLRIATGRASSVAVMGEVIQSVPGSLAMIPAEDDASLKMLDVSVDRHPTQQGLRGGQPWAVVTWKTDRPATSQVEFQTAEGPLRRTPLSTRLTCSHRCRVDFLRDEKAYSFTAVSVLPSGLRSTVRLVSD